MAFINAQDYNAQDYVVYILTKCMGLIKIMSKLIYFLAMNGISTCKLAQRGHYMV